MEGFLFTLSPYFNEVFLVFGVDADYGEIVLPLEMNGGSRVCFRRPLKKDVSVHRELRGAAIFVQCCGFKIIG
jgi:hypothetical protein